MLLYIDTNVFLNVVYRERKMFETSKKLLEKVAKGDARAITSSITLMEIKSVMAKNGHKAVADEAVALVEDINGLTIMPLDQTMVKVAAEHFLQDRLTVHDAYHLATALCGKTNTFVTRDKDLTSKISKHINVTQPEEEL